MPTNINFSNNLGILSGNSISIAQTLTPFCNEYSMEFDGVSDYFEGSSTFSELDGQSQFSLSMWIKPDALDAIRILFHIQKNTTAAASQVLVFLRNNGVLDISADVSSKYCRSQVGSIQAGVWNHVLICFDLSQGNVANKIRPFVNGVDVYDGSNGLGTSFVTSTGPIHLGEEANGYTNPFLGKMDEVALWNSDQRANVSDIYNGGLPFDLSTLGTPPDHWYRMGDNDVFNTNWTLSDNVGSYDLTSVSMPVGARVTDVAFLNEYSMTFDGSSDYAFVGTSSLGITSAITVSAWVKIPTTNTGGGGTNIQTIICEDTTSGGQRNWNLSWRGTGFNYFQWSVFAPNGAATTIVSSGVVPNDGFWHHVMGTYDGTTGTNGVKLYIDGSLSNQATASFAGINSNTGSEATIGALTSAAGRFFEGEIDEVAVWDNDESSNINSIYSSSGALDISCLNPLSWWRMGDGDSFSTNWTFFDNGSGGNDATSSTLPEAARLPITANSYSQNSFVFDGAPDFVTMGNPASLQITGALTLSAWVKTGDNRDAIILSKDDQTNRCFSLSANLPGGGANYTSLYIFSGGTATGVVSNTLLTAGTWYHVMAVFKPSTYMRIYINGVLDAENTTSIPSSIDNDPADFVIGKGLSAGYHFFGNIDEVYVWDNDQSGNISTIYGNGVPTDISSLNPLGHWRFGETDTFTTSWTFVDQGSGGNDGTSSTLPEEAKTGDQPYVI